MYMNEQVFDIEVKGDAVYGIWHHPDSEGNIPDKNVGIIFLHGWAGHRPGPHDMLIKLARRLSADGYDCFRFDFRGKGYSQGDRKHTGNHSMMEDLEAVLLFVNKSLNNPSIVLTGICSGAKLAFYYARNGNLPITHVIDLSSPVLRQQEVSSTLAINQVKNTTKQYINKFFNRETWQRLVNGEIHFSVVCRNISKPLSQLFAGKRKASNQNVNKEPPKNKPEKKPFGKLKGQMLLIHGEKDPSTVPALRQINQMLYNHQIPSEIHIVKDANHSFYSLAWEDEIISVIQNWLNSRSF